MRKCLTTSSWIFEFGAVEKRVVENLVDLVKSFQTSILISVYFQYLLLTYEIVLRYIREWTSQSLQSLPKIRKKLELEQNPF